MDTLSAYLRGGLPRINENLWWFVDAVVLCLPAVIALGLIGRLMYQGIDEVGIIIKSGTDMENEQAAAVLPIVRKKHKFFVALLLLVLWSAAAIQALGIHLEVALFSSVVVAMFVVSYLLIFGKVIAQRVFRRFGVAVNVIAGTLGVCCHIARPQAGKDGELNHRETSVALDLMKKTAKDVMIPIESTLSVALDSKLNWELIAEILAKGYSHVPVYSISPGNIIGMLQTKTLIQLWGPEANTPIMNLPISVMPSVEANMPLGDIFMQFKKEGIHMAIVEKVLSKDEEGRRLTKAQEVIEFAAGRDIGIITFQDVMQELFLNDKQAIARLLGET